MLSNELLATKLADRSYAVDYVLPRDTEQAPGEHAEGVDYVIENPIFLPDVGAAD